jgi:hypothetical protein
MDAGTDLGEQVQKALVAHGAWKVRLAQTIDASSSEFSPDVVRQDNQCALGKWLYEGIGPALRHGDHYQRVRKLHAGFHIAAAGVLELGLQGRKQEARAAMQPSSEFARASTQLSLALTAWRTAVGSPLGSPR